MSWKQWPVAVHLDAFSTYIKSTLITILSGRPLRWCSHAKLSITDKSSAINILIQVLICISESVNVRSLNCPMADLSDYFTFLQFIIYYFFL